MLPILKKIKQKAAANKGEKDSFLDAKAAIKTDTLEVHSVHCRDFNAAEVEGMSLRSIISFEPECECLDHAIYRYNDTHQLRTATSILKVMNSVKETPTFSELKFAASENRTEAVRSLAELIFSCRNFGSFGSPDRLDFAVSHWLHVTKGYPSSYDALIEVYLDAVEKVHGRHVPEAISNIEALGIKEAEVIDRLSKERTASERVICETLHARTHFQMANGGFLAAVILVALRKEKLPGANLVSLPPLLALAAQEYSLVHSYANSFVNVESTPTPTDMMTIETLRSNGMALNEAVTAASKLN